MTEAALDGNDADDGANALVDTNNAAFDGDDGGGGTGMLADVSDITDAAPNRDDEDVGTDVLADVMADVADVPNATPIGDDDDDGADVLVDTNNTACDGDDGDEGTGMADVTDVIDLTNTVPNGDDDGDTASICWPMWPTPHQTTPHQATTRLRSSICGLTCSTTRMPTMMLQMATTATA